MDANYIYIIVTLIILIYLYSVIESNIYASQRTVKLNDNNNKIMIDLNGNLIETDTNHITNHLIVIKNNLIALKKSDFTSFNNESYNKLDELIYQSIADTAHNLFGEKLDLMEKIQRSDISLDNNEEFIKNKKMRLQQLIIDLEIVTLIIKISSTDAKGYIRLTNLHQLLNLVSLVSTGKNYLTYDDLFSNLDTTSTNVSYTDCGYSNVDYSRKYDDARTSLSNYKFLIDDTNTYSNLYSNDYGRDGKMPWAKSINIMNSQDVMAGYNTLPYDGELFVNDEDNILLPYKEVEPVFRANQYTQNTQLFENSDTTYITKRDIIPSYIPFYNLTKIRSDISKKKKKTVDYNSRQALREDYNL
jgi:hypothetical protein